MNDPKDDYEDFLDAGREANDPHVIAIYAVATALLHIANQLLILNNTLDPLIIETKDRR